MSKTIPDFGCKDLQSLLDFAPICVEDRDELFSLHFYKASQGYIAEYSFITERVHVDLQGVKFLYRKNLFDTFREGKTLYDTLLKLLILLHENREGLSFIPRIHPFNKS